MCTNLDPACHGPPDSVNPSTKTAILPTLNKNETIYIFLKGLDSSDISFPDPGGEMRHWWASGVALRGREGCGASIAMIIRCTGHHAMVCEPSRHPTTSGTPCRVERGCREAPTVLTAGQPKIISVHDFSRCGAPPRWSPVTTVGAPRGAPLASGRFLRGSEVSQGLLNHHATSRATYYHCYRCPAPLPAARSRCGGPPVPDLAARSPSRYICTSHPF